MSKKVVLVIGDIGETLEKVEFFKILQGFEVKTVLLGKYSEKTRADLMSAANRFGLDFEIAELTQANQIVRQAFVALHTSLEERSLIVSKMMSFGVPVIKKATNENSPLIEHKKDGYLYLDPTWARQWLTVALAEEQTVKEMGNRAKQIGRAHV